MSPKKIAGPVVAVLALAVTAGCASGSAPAGGSTLPAGAPDANVSAASTPAASSATPSAAAIPAGTVLTDAQVAALPDNVKAYPMPDGTKIAVVADQPMPAPVLDHLTAQAQAVDSKYGVRYNGDDNAKLDQELSAQVRDATLATGKRLVVIFHAVRAYDIDKPLTLWISTETGSVYDPVHHAVAVQSKDDAVAQVQAWVSKQSDPSHYTVAVMN